MDEQICIHQEIFTPKFTDLESRVKQESRLACHASGTLSSVTGSNTAVGVSSDLPEPSLVRQDCSHRQMF
jgi:hypothetical protein